MRDAVGWLVGDGYSMVVGSYGMVVVWQAGRQVGR